MSKPRWKVLIELIGSIVFTFIGIQLFLDSIHGQLMFDVFPSWVGILFGLLITFTWLPRIGERWAEL